MKLFGWPRPLAPRETTPAPEPRIRLAPFGSVTECPKCGQHGGFKPSYRPCFRRFEFQTWDPWHEVGYGPAHLHLECTGCGWAIDTETKDAPALRVVA